MQLLAQRGVRCSLLLLLGAVIPPQVVNRRLVCLLHLPPIGRMRRSSLAMSYALKGRLHDSLASHRALGNPQCKCLPFGFSLGQQHLLVLGSAVQGLLQGIRRGRLPLQQLRIEVTLQLQSLIH